MRNTRQFIESFLVNQPVVVEVPQKLTAEQRDLLYKLDSTSTPKQYPKKTAFKDKM